MDQLSSTVDAPVADKSPDVIPPAWAPIAGLIMLVGASAYLLVDFATNYIASPFAEARTQWLVFVGLGVIAGLLAGTYDLRRVSHEPEVSPEKSRPPIVIWIAIFLALIVAPLIGRIDSLKREKQCSCLHWVRLRAPFRC
jgi:hypothetical protein